MENVSPVLSLTPVPEQSQDHMESCSQGVGEGDSQQKEQFQTEIANVAEETVEESDKSSKGNSPIKKTWGFRQSTVAKREMPVEAATSSSENCCPVRRSRRQAKRTDKLEEFLLTAKRGTRKSAPPSLESGDPPSQTPTDAETASEASFDGNADTKAAESPERRTRSSTRKQTLHKTRSGRQTRSGGGAAASDQGSSENEESRDPAKNDQLQNDEMKEETNDSSPKDVDGTKKAESPPEIDSDKKEVIEEKDQHGKEQDKAEIEKDTDEESEDNPSALVVKRGPLRTYVNKKKAANKTTAANKVITPVKRETKPKATPAAGKTRMTHNNDENDSSTSSSSSSSSPESDGGYDPNALYCICRQRHNKRFMICCDRCEEWFHGDCVGITEARGRLMERNGEDYVCPNCTAKKNQVVRPATSLLSTNIEGMKSKADVAPLTSAENSTAEKTNTSMGLSAVTVATPPSSISTGTEEKGSEDIGIKGRIEKATNPTGKKKIKIFQPQVMQQTAEPKAAQKALVEKKAVPTADQKALPDTEQKVASNVEVKTSPVGEEQRQKVGEESSLPKCIGPGCESNAQPDSVYCGNDCILRHAAVTMKSITDVKEPTQKEEAQKSTQKKSPAGRKKTRKTTDEDLDSDEDYSPDLDEDDEDEHAEEYPPSPTTASWSSDHNYIAVAPEKTTTISPTVLNKKSPPKEEKRSEKEQKEKESAVTPEKPSPAPAAPVTRNQKSTATKKSPTTKAAKVSLKSKKRTVRTSSSKTSKKPEPAPSKTAAKGKKAAPSASRTPSPFPPGPIHVTGALRVVKSNFTIPKKQPQQKDSHSHSSSSLSRVPSSPVSSSPSAHSSSSSSSRPSHPAASPMPPPPNNQMRQNIRRSLTDILYKRVSDSDDLKMTESEVGRLAVGIEKEMFNLCLSTDSKYKNKYRSLMFNLKDPKNKGLFYRVISGEVSPFRLVRLSAEELLSKEISEWRKPDAPEAQSHSTRHHSGQSKLSSRHDSSSHSIDSEDAPPTSDADDQDESGCSPSASAQASAVDGANNMPDIFSNMLKDTTSEHRAHLFDLNCKICTGQRTEDEPAAKKAKLTKKSETRPSTQDSSRPDNASPAVQPQDSTAYHHQDPLAYPHSLPSSYQSNLDIPEVQQQQPHQDDLNMLIPLMQAPVPLVPTVSSVSITRRDPRMARHSSSVTVTYTAPEKPTNTVAEGLHAPVTASVEIVPKAPLPMPPASPSSAAILKSSKTSTSEPPPEGETAIFLHGQERIWKGFINMHSVAKFVTKAYLVSGSFEHLKEDLPDTILIEGRISPNTVWDYVGKLKTSLSKELCLIRFHPATEEEEVAYVSLFSYFSSRKRFGVVAKNNRRIKDLYLIPLGSKDPLPSKLLPFDGPGLEPARPNLLLGLLICQKDRKRTGASLETEEKRFKAQTKEVEDTGLPKPPLSVRAERNTRLSMEIPFSTTPPGSPPSTSVEASSGIVTPSSGMSLLSAVKASPNSSTIGRDSPTSSSSISSSAPVANPLQTILNTLFRKKTPNSDASNSPSDQGGGLSIPPATMLDPIVKQYAQTSKDKPEEEDEDDRPYDPEEEYDPSRGYSVPKKSVELVSKVDVLKQPEIAASEADDVAYDPEDDSIFDEVKPLVSSQAKTSSECNPEPQKILESLKQIGDQTHQSQGDQQMLSTETSGASQTLVDTLIPPSTKSLLANSQLLQLGKQVEALVKSSTVAPLINQRRDPRQSRDLHQTSTGFKSADESEEKEETPAPLKDSAPPSKPQLPDVPDLPDSSQAGETIQPKEEVKCDSLPFMELDKSEVSIPLLGEEMGPDMEFNYMDEKEEKSEEAELSVESEKEVDKYSVWPNAASILKATDDSDHDENSRDTSVTSFFKETEITNTITSAIPVLTKTTIAESQPHHISHRISAPGFDSEYRPLADISPQSTFPTPHPMQGQNLIMRPPPMTIPPPTEGLSPMSGPPLMQGPLPPIHVPPSVRAPPPMQGDSSQQYGPPLTSFPPYQNQWRGIQPLPQQPPPGPAPQNILPPRGPPLPPFPPVAQRGPPHMFDASIAPQHIGKQGPPPGLPPPPTFDRQSTLPPPRFTGPPPPFNFPASRGPPHPPFTVPPPGHFDNRLPPPSHFHAPRGAPPSQYSDFKTQPPLVDQHRGPAEQYNKDSPNSFKLNMDQNPNSHHIFKDNQALPPGPAYRGPPSSQYEDRRGPPPSGEVSGQHFNQHNQYGSSRQHSSPPHRGSFDDHRVPLPQENRPHSSQPFGGSEHYRFDRHSDEPRPVRHSGPLLPTPPDISLGPPSRIGAHSPDLHRDDNWRLLSPEMRRRSSLTQEDLETRSGDHISRFDGGHREPAMGPSQPSNERQREVSEDRRGLRGEREVPHVGRPSWDRGQGKRWSREREWDRGKERDRDHERSRERDRSRGKEGDRHRDMEGERHRDQESDKRRDRERERPRARESDRRDYNRERVKNRDRERDHDRERDRDRDRERDRERERERDRDRDRERERDHDRDRDRDRRDRERDRKRDRSRSRERSRDRDRDHGKDRGRDRDRDRDRERDRDRDKDRDRRERSRSREKREDRKDSKRETAKESDKTDDKNVS